MKKKIVNSVKSILVMAAKNWMESMRYYSLHGEGVSVQRVHPLSFSAAALRSRRLGGQSVRPQGGVSVPSFSRSFPLRL